MFLDAHLRRTIRGFGKRPGFGIGEWRETVGLARCGDELPHGVGFDQHDVHRVGAFDRGSSHVEDLPAVVPHGAGP
jgi:hypothetical protein